MIYQDMEVGVRLYVKGSIEAYQVKEWEEEGIKADWAKVCLKKSKVKAKGESHVRFSTLGECPLEGHLSSAASIVR